MTHFSRRFNNREPDEWHLHFDAPEPRVAETVATE